MVVVYIYCCHCCCLVVKSCLTPTHRLLPARLLCPWDFPGKNTGVGCHFHLQGIFLTQESNPCFLHWQMGSLLLSYQFSSVQSSHSIMYNSLWPHGLQHSRPPCPSPTPRVYSNSCPSSRWCHPTISSSVVHFSPHLQSFPASGSFQMSQLFTSGGQSIGASASTSVLPMNTQDYLL